MAKTETHWLALLSMLVLSLAGIVCTNLVSATQPESISTALQRAFLPASQDDLILAASRQSRLNKARAKPKEAQKTVKAELQDLATYKRDEVQTYLALPEWFVVYHPDEYAKFLKTKRPSDFPYFGSIEQFWEYYRDVYAVTKDKYPFNWRHHLMTFMIGTGFTVENSAKGIYENTIGRITAWSSDQKTVQSPTAEDLYAAKVAQDYVDFIRAEPWYEFDFSKRLKGLWMETSLTGPNWVRKWERKLALSVEYSVKSQYASAIGVAAKVLQPDPEGEMLALAENISAEMLKDDPKIKIIKQFDDSSALLSLPRSKQFRDSVLRLAKKGGTFKEIAGNKQILLTSVVPASWKYDLPAGKVLFEKPILTSPGEKRIAINAPVQALHNILLQLSRNKFVIEQVYDY